MKLESEGEDDGEDDEDEEVVAVSQRTRTKGKKADKDARRSLRGSGGMFPRVTRKKGKRASHTLSSDESSAEEQEQEESEEEPVGEPESSGDEAMATTPGKVKRRIAGRVKKEDNFVNDESSELEIVSPAKPRRGKARQRVHFSESSDGDGGSGAPNGNKGQEDSEEDDDDDVVKPSRRNRVSTTPERRLSTLEQDDLDEDLAFLRSSPLNTERDLATPRKPSARQQAMDELRRRRQGLPSSSAPPEGDDVAGDGDSADDIESSEDDVPVSNWWAPRSGRRKRQGRAEDEEIVEVEGADEDDENNDDGPTAHDILFNADDDDDAFIESDDPEAPLGVALPSEFTAKRPLDYFRDVVRWLIHRALDPTLPPTDEYARALLKCDTAVSGLASSKFVSSVWKPDFVRALKARPQIDAVEQPGVGVLLGVAGCMACGREKNTASRSVKFTGKPYDRTTLEPLSQERDEDEDEDENEEDDDDDDRDIDADGAELLPEHHAFAIGSHCMANAATAHELEHWRFALREWVVDKVRDDGHLNRARRRGSEWSARKKERLARKVFEGWDQEGEVKRIHSMFKASVKAAEGARNEYWER